MSSEQIQGTNKPGTQSQKPTAKSSSLHRLRRRRQEPRSQEGKIQGRIFEADVQHKVKELSVLEGANASQVNSKNQNETEKLKAWVPRQTHPPEANRKGETEAGRIKGLTKGELQ